VRGFLEQFFRSLDALKYPPLMRRQACSVTEFSLEMSHRQVAHRSEFDDAEIACQVARHELDSKPNSTTLRASGFAWYPKADVKP
jgi:hypothetical protein